MPRFLRSSAFWTPCCITLAICSVFFAWELGYFINYLPGIPRPGALPWEIGFTSLLSVLLALDIGLIIWQNRYGNCPRGMKRLSSAAGIIGAFTLICPACLLLPASLVSLGVFFAFIHVYLPLLRIGAIIVLLIATAMLWPRR